MLVLGVNCLYHESSACLIADGRLAAAAEEERFNRRKHGKKVRPDNPDELPRHAIDFCLNAAGARPSDVDHVAVAGDPVVMRRVWRTRAPSPWSDWADHATFLDKLPAVETAFVEFRSRADRRSQACALSGGSWYEVRHEETTRGEATAGPEGTRSRRVDGPGKRNRAG